MRKVIATAIALLMAITFICTGAFAQSPGGGLQGGNPSQGGGNIQASQEALTALLVALEAAGIQV